MNKPVCPFLGLKEDQKTALLFPSDGNFCFHARPVAPVSREHQANFCLSAAHVNCPVFKAAHPVPLPTAYLAPLARRTRIRRMAAIIGIPVIVAATAAIAGSFGLTNAAAQAISRVFLSNDPGVTDPAFQLKIPVSGFFSGPPAVENTPTPLQVNLQSPTPLPQPLVSNCKLPSGWVPYKIQPTDSLFRLSVLYGVSLETLQNSNCLSENTVLHPGDVIYVPEAPILTSTSSQTPTQSATATATPTASLADNLPINPYNNVPVYAPQPTSTKVKTSTPIPPEATATPPFALTVPATTTATASQAEPTVTPNPPINPSPTSPPSSPSPTNPSPRKGPKATATSTSIPPTPTPIAPTATSIPPTPVPPLPTPIPPTETSIPPTPVPPSPTPIPPTATSVPPTATQPPPPPPPTATSPAPTATQAAAAP